MTTDYRALCAELADELDDRTGYTIKPGEVMTLEVVKRARAALAAEPELPTEIGYSSWSRGASYCKERRDEPLSLVINCRLSGQPPKPFASWSDYFNNVQESGVISGLRIEAIRSITTEPESQP